MKTLIKTIKFLILPIAWMVFIAEVFFLIINKNFLIDANSSIIVTSFVALMVTSYFTSVKNSSDIEKAKGAIKLSVSELNIVTLENVGQSELKIMSTKSYAELFNREEINDLAKVFDKLDFQIQGKDADVLSKDTSLAPGETIILPVMQTDESGIELVELKVTKIEVIYKTLGKKIRAKFYIQYSRDPDSVGILHFWQGEKIEPQDTYSIENRKKVQAIKSNVPNNKYNILRIVRNQIK